MPRARTVVQLTFTNLPAADRDWWLVIRPDEVDICRDDPGFGVDVAVHSELSTLTRIWGGNWPWSEALRAGALHVDGPAEMRRGLPRWLELSMFAAVPRPA